MYNPLSVCLYTAKEEAEEPPAKLLDDLFKKTKATPCIYWLPLTEEQVSYMKNTWLCKFCNCWIFLATVLWSAQAKLILMQYAIFQGFFWIREVLLKMPWFQKILLYIKEYEDFFPRIFPGNFDFYGLRPIWWLKMVSHTLCWLSAEIFLNYGYFVQIW